MTVFETLKQHQLTARKARDSTATGVLTTLLGELQRGAAKEEPTDDRVFSVATSMRENILANQARVGVDDKSAQELIALDAILVMKPAAVDDAQILSAVEAAIAANPAIIMKELMLHLRQLFGGRLDGAAASRIVKSQLAC